MLFLGFGRLIYGMFISPSPLRKSIIAAFVLTEHDSFFLTVTVLLINAVAVLSEDRFLARSALLTPINFPVIKTSKLRSNQSIKSVGWGRTQQEPSFGSSYDNSSIKARTVNLITSVRTVMRSMFSFLAGCHRSINIDNPKPLGKAHDRFVLIVIPPPCSTADRDKYGYYCL